MMLKKMLSGIATFIPGVNRFRAKGTGGTISALYCYSVWLRHLVMAKANGLVPYPKTVAELGPGDSLGIGLAALISGCEKYFAFDVVAHANSARNLSVFLELVDLFRNRTPIPGDDEFERVKPYLEDYRFPVDILDDTVLKSALEESRLARIQYSIMNPQDEISMLRYTVPWHADSVLQKSSIDMIYSQAVLEHVNDLRSAYKAMHSWLKTGGFMSHEIDFKSHRTAPEWNGHWRFSDRVWKIIKGTRSYWINREPHSTHISIMNEVGFRVVCDRAYFSESSLAKEDLAPRFRTLSDEDMRTSGAFIQAVKENKSNSNS